MVKIFNSKSLRTPLILLCSAVSCVCCRQYMYTIYTPRNGRSVGGACCVCAAEKFGDNEVVIEIHHRQGFFTPNNRRMGRRRWVADAGSFAHFSHKITTESGTSCRKKKSGFC